jgi:hypothetical protein
MPEFRVSEISGTQGWIGLWVPALGLTPLAGMTMRQPVLRFDQVGICSRGDYLNSEDRENEEVLTIGALSAICGWGSSI